MSGSSPDPEAVTASAGTAGCAGALPRIGTICPCVVLAERCALNRDAPVLAMNGVGRAAWLMLTTRVMVPA